MLPAIFGSSVAQINVLLSGIIASLLPVGSISYLYYSDRLMEFPLGLFGIALATVTLPYLSRLWANGDRNEFAQTLEWSMKIAILIAVPAAVGLVMLAAPLITTLFHGGEFDQRSVDMTVLALQAYAVGLVGFSFVKVLAPAFLRSRGYANAGTGWHHCAVRQPGAGRIVCLVSQQSGHRRSSRGPCGRNVGGGRAERRVAVSGSAQGWRYQARTGVGHAAPAGGGRQRCDDHRAVALASFRHWWTACAAVTDRLAGCLFRCAVPASILSPCWYLVSDRRSSA